MNGSSITNFGIFAEQNQNRKTWPSILKTVARPCHKASAVAGAVLFIQIPAFINHYKLTIGYQKEAVYRNLYKKVIDCRKHFPSSTRHVNEWNIWKLAQACVHQYKNDDSLTDPDATSFEKGVSRLFYQTTETLSSQWKKLSETYNDLDDASPLTRPLAFIKHYDHTFAKKVWRDYRLALPISTDAILYGLCGAFVGSSLFAIAYRTITHLNQNKRGDNHD